MDKFTLSWEGIKNQQILLSYSDTRLPLRIKFITAVMICRVRLPCHGVMISNSVESYNKSED